jgi:GNAT superfamily N-acetyltransferase
MTRKIITRAEITKAAEPAIAEAKSGKEIARCYPVMRELRTHLSTPDEFVERVQRQQKDGYRIVYLEAGGKIRAVAGYRLSESLFAGRFLYVDDLVTSAKDRSAGFGGQLFDWLVRFARAQKCQHLELDSGVQRFDAHRFYLMKRMSISSHHFTLKL